MFLKNIKIKKTLLPTPEREILQLMILANYGPRAAQTVKQFLESPTAAARHRTG